MKIFDHNFLINNLVDHPYESNPEYLAKVNLFYISQDKKFLAAYWEAPEGWFDAAIDGFNEINYVVEGEIDLISEDKTLTAKKGDCFMVENGDRIKWRIKKFIRTFFFVYPATGDLIELFKKMIEK